MSDTTDELSQYIAGKSACSPDGGRRPRQRGPYGMCPKKSDAVVRLGLKKMHKKQRCQLGAGVLTKTSSQPAARGFDALADLDSKGNGWMNAQDAAFASLRIWRDLNQDGISQVEELQTLAESGIVSIGVKAVNQRVELGNGYVQAAQGTFTRTSGATGGMGETPSTTAYRDLLVNSFYRTFSTSTHADGCGAGPAGEARLGSGAGPARCQYLAQHRLHVQAAQLAPDHGSN